MKRERKTHTGGRSSSHGVLVSFPVDPPLQQRVDCPRHSTARVPGSGGTGESPLGRTLSWVQGEEGRRPAMDPRGMMAETCPHSLGASDTAAQDCTRPLPPHTFLRVGSAEGSSPEGTGPRALQPQARWGPPSPSWLPLRPGRSYAEGQGPGGQSRGFPGHTRLVCQWRCDSSPGPCSPSAWAGLTTRIRGRAGPEAPDGAPPGQGQSGQDQGRRPRAGVMPTSRRG